MTYIETLNFIKDIASQEQMVNSTDIGDVYKILAKPDIMYPIVTCDITGVNLSFIDNTSQTVSYNVYIWYVDRTLHDNTNVKEIQSDACLTLQSILNSLFDEIGTQSDYSINVFEQKFSDYCAGAEVLLSIDVYNELGECSINDIDDIEPEKTLLINKNGTYNVKEYTKAIVNVAGGIQPNNLIWYMSSDNNIVTPNYLDRFGANLISNTYSDGKGIMTFDGNVTTIGHDVFTDKTTLVSISIPNTVTSIEYSAFRGCNGLSNIIIPDNVTNIEGMAFNECENLFVITIGDKVNNIAGGVLYDCERLSSIIYLGTMSQWELITKNPQWIGNTLVNVIHCLDGDILL